MARTTPSLVRGIVDTDDSIDLAPFIDPATDMVTEHCTESGYSDTKLELLERWLAAHFYAIRDPRVASEAAGSVQQSYQYDVGLNLNVTMYGQQVLLIDSAGTLAALNKQAEDGVPRKAPRVAWLGRTRRRTE